MPPFPPDATHLSGRRLIAHMVDNVLIGLLGLVAIVACVALGAATGADDLFATIGAVLFLLWILPGQVLYFTYHGRRGGSSPGKGVMGIKVVDADGRPPSTGAMVRRSIPLLIEYLYVIALIGMLSSSYRQRLGDRWAHTYVVPA